MVENWNREPMKQSNILQFILQNSKMGFMENGKVPHSHYKIHRCLWPRSSCWLVELCVKTKNLKVNSKDSYCNAKIPQYLDISSVLPQKELFILKAKVFRLDSNTFFAGLSKTWVHWTYKWPKIWFTLQSKLHIPSTLNIDLILWLT